MANELFCDKCGKRPENRILYLCNDDWLCIDCAKAFDEAEYNKQEAN